MHIHVQSADGEAKFWIEPAITLVKSKGFFAADLRLVQDIIEEHQDEIRVAWHRHFGD
jgi:hypothetical protein